MKLLKTRYYPVNVRQRKIYNVPQKTLRELINGWGRYGYIGIKGHEIMAHNCYKDFKIVPVSSWD